ncbi:hypothetical protein VU01_12113 [Candidatus Electrothrix marina]|uniref:Uncharacterized protein n=1 Tax=Candidatus Electrothrix marina TaxID=1859130 RepID=A0A444JDB4_9BACT|nr:hypothetical protein VU01_12113 [Candidatus Electrothrix marina]
MVRILSAHHVRADYHHRYLGGHGDIPLLTRVLSETGDIRRSIADVLSLDYLGALIGSVAFPLFPLPFLGLFRASFVIDFFNAGVALFNVAVFSSLLRFPRRYAALALLISTLITNERITAFAEGQLYADSIIFSDVVDVHWHYYAPIGITMIYVLCNNPA